MKSLVLALLLGSLVLWLPPTRALAAIPGDCRNLGSAITGHSCFHAEFGPFASVLATDGIGATPVTPDISAVHTEYRVGLTGEYSVVTYTPARSGAWVVLLGSNVPLQVLSSKASPLPSQLDQLGDTGCEALPVAHVFELTASTKYRLVLGPTAERSVVSVIEYVDDFLTQNGADQDGDGFGDSAAVVITPCRPPPGFAPNRLDCDDDNPLIHPDAAEICDGVDQNCNYVPDDVGLDCRAGVGACRVQGRIVCGASGELAVCGAVEKEAAPESCNGVDDDCDGKVDDGAALCTEVDRPTCVRRGTSASCGCLLDLDCGATNSARICDASSGVCRDGCSSLPGRNGCAAGMICDDTAGRCEEASGAGGASAHAGESAGEAGSSSWPGAAGGAAGAPSAEDESQRSGGCGCMTTSSAASNPSWWMAAFFGAALVARRRGRRLVGLAFFGFVVVGCGGRVLDPLPTDDGYGDEPEPPSGGGGAGFGGASGGGSAGGVQACERELGEEPTRHACSHAANGPFVAAVTGGSAPPADVSELHHTYEVQVLGGGARLSYRAQRTGGHAFMTTAALQLELTQGDHFLDARPDFAVDGCGSLSRATVYELQSGESYELRLLESPARFELFVEHLGAFGAGAWTEPCTKEKEP